jgi:hypothetical protein
VREALYALPSHFDSATKIDGMLAPDIFTLSSALGATIEEQVVQTLNRIRSVWDPDKKYQAYGFIRQPQIFPDVVLRKKTNGTEILLGIELKGWYLLANEGEPNFRFKVNPGCCNPWDLIAVVPWVLSNVLSGSPVVYDVFVDQARYSAEHRNFYWEHLRSTEGDRTITLAQDIRPYPLKKDRISDTANNDRGNNFGRMARYGSMKDYVDRMMVTGVRGLPVREWLDFFRTHARQDAPAPLPPVAERGS